MIFLIALLVLSHPALADEFPVTETDALGKTLTLDAPPKRIVSLAPSNTEILFALGLADHIVGVTEYCNYPPEAAQKPQVGEFSKSSLESIVALQPDFVLAARFNQLDLLDGLRAFHIPVFALAPITLSDALATIHQVGRLTGTTPLADSLVSDLETRKAAVGVRVKKIAPKDRPRVLWGNLKAPMYTAGAESYINDLIRQAGGVNLGAKAGTGWPQVGLETLVTWDPQAIITSSNPDKIREALIRLQDTEGWKEIHAIRHKNVYHIDSDLLQRPGPRVIDALEILANRLHPHQP